MSNDTELKPCPFCGGTSIYKITNPIDKLIGTATVCCRECCSSAPLHNWNTRADQQLVNELTEKLKYAMTAFCNQVELDIIHPNHKAETEAIANGIFRLLNKVKGGKL